MPFVQRIGDLASCGDPIDPPAGVPTVFANGIAIAKVNLSTVVTGPIIGPGAIRVFAEGFVVSVTGDLVASHPAGSKTHVGAILAAGSPNVYAG